MKLRGEGAFKRGWAETQRWNEAGPNPLLAHGKKRRVKKDLGVGVTSLVLFTRRRTSLFLTLSLPLAVITLGARERLLDPLAKEESERRRNALKSRRPMCQGARSSTSTARGNLPRRRCYVIHAEHLRSQL